MDEKEEKNLQKIKDLLKEDKIVRKCK